MERIKIEEKDYSFSILQTLLDKKESTQEEIAYSLYNAPHFKQLFIGSTSSGICFLAPISSLEPGMEELKEQFPKATLIHKKSLMQESVSSFFNGRHSTKEKIQLHLMGTTFQLKVWMALLSIPMGKTTTYQSIAEQIGHTKAYRAVGTAIGKNPISLLIPCHRVIRSDGKLGGYRWGKQIKEEILNWESNRIQQDF